MRGHIVSFKRTPEEDYIEPELVSPGPESRGSGGEGAGPDRRKNYPPVFLKVKLVLMATALAAGFGLTVLGAILASTLIGAVIGIPLILTGVAILRLLFGFLGFGGKNKTFIFKRF